MDVKEYWNTTARACAPKTKLIDNYTKRRALLSELLKYSFENQKILEIGPGLGITSFIVQCVTPKMQYKGIDISQNFAERAQQLLKRDIVVGDASELPFQDQEFDSLWAFDVLEHIFPEKRQQTFDEINRVLKPERSIFICNPLSVSFHDDEFDFEFNSPEIAKLAIVTNTIIYKVKLLQAFKNYYQFIELRSIRYQNEKSK
jgi:ubiquinone/menaquinone biosynthesis C-methylase UbiE